MWWNGLCPEGHCDTRSRIMHDRILSTRGGRAAEGSGVGEGGWGTRQRPSLKSFCPSASASAPPPSVPPLSSLRLTLGRAGSGGGSGGGGGGGGVPRARAFNVSGPITGVESPCGNDARFLAPRRLPEASPPLAVLSVLLFLSFSSALSILIPPVFLDYSLISIADDVRNR